MIRPTPRHRLTRPIEYQNFDRAAFVQNMLTRSKAITEPPVKRIIYKAIRTTWVAPTDMHPSIEKLYVQYYNKNEIPSIGVRMTAFREAGYPEEVLASMKEKWEARLEAKPELDKFVRDIFGKVSTKKDAPPKKKTLSQLLNIKKPREVKRDDEDDE